MTQPLNTQLEEVMTRVTRYMRKQMIGAIKQHDLTMTQLETLIFIKINQPVRMKDIAENFEISMPSSTILVDKLVAMKLVDRKADPKDRRNVTITLTNKGDSLLQQGRKHKSEQINAMLNVLSQEERKTLLSIFSTLAERLEKNDK